MKQLVRSFALLLFFSQLIETQKLYMGRTFIEIAMPTGVFTEGGDTSQGGARQTDRKQAGRFS